MMNRKERLELADIKEAMLYDGGFPYPISDAVRELVIVDINNLRGSLGSVIRDE